MSIQRILHCHIGFLGPLPPSAAHSIEIWQANNAWLVTVSIQKDHFLFKFSNFCQLKYSLVA